MQARDFFDDLIPPPIQIVRRSGAGEAPRRLVLNLDFKDPAHGTSFERLSAIVLKPWLTKAGGTATQLVVRLKPGYVVAGARRLQHAIATESYELDMGRDLKLTAPSYAGLCMGLQTLKQVLENAARTGTLPYCRIGDWPRLAQRGIHMDLAREMEYRPAHLHRVVEHLAYLRMNTLHLYLENKFVFPSAPEVAPPRVMTPAQARELCDYARLFGITIIPQISTLGHMEHLLHGPYAELRENASSSYNLCPTHPKSRPFLAGLIADVAAAFRSPYIHVGYDESHSGVCPRCRALGTPQKIIADHLNWLDGEIRKHGARTMIYGDKFLSEETFPRSDALNGGTAKEARDALGRVSRNITVTDWHYTAPHGDTTRHLVKEGFEVHTVSATNIYWHDTIPLSRGHHWIVETIDHGVAAGATGAFNSNWEYYRGQYFDNFWYFQALAAERMWSAAPHDYIAWGARFARRFWDVDEDIYGELAGLAQTAPVGRRHVFLDSDVLSVDLLSGLTDALSDWRQIRFDYRELGEYIIGRAHQLFANARRNRDTLRILDMPGQIIRYIGIRGEQRHALEQALKCGDKPAALKSISTIKAAALQVAGRLAEGYRIYGGAVEDRKRLARHIATLDAYADIVRRTPAAALKREDLRHFMSLPVDPSTQPSIHTYSASELQPPAGKIAQAALPQANLVFTDLPYIVKWNYIDIRAVHQKKNGLLYIAGVIKLTRGGKGKLLYGADGPVKVWVNDVFCGCEPDAAAPIAADQFSGPATWKKGTNRILFALNTAGGQAWGVTAMCQVTSG